MTKATCAAELYDKTFSQINELTERFLLDMLEAGLIFCFCPDDKNFHTIGAHTEEILFAWDKPANANIIACYDSDGTLHFMKDREMINDEIAINDNNPGGLFIEIKWGQTSPGRQGFIFNAGKEAIPIIVEDEQDSCVGVLFSTADIPG